MVSFHISQPESPKKITAVQEFENPSKKRKWEDSHVDDHDDQKQSHRESGDRKSLFDIELHLETPLPSEWQQCLNVQSGRVHFYNTRTHKKTAKDPRVLLNASCDQPPSQGDDSHVSLNLELNLTCSDQSKGKVGTEKSMIYKQQSSNSSNSNLYNISRCPSWLSFEGDQQEMLATVCMKCHMLVILCKSSPSCPNCKFMHPPNQNLPSLVKRRCGLLCL